MNSSSVGNVLRRLREQKSVSQSQIARQCELSPAKVSRIESNEVIPDEIELTKILSAIDTDMSREFRIFLKQEWNLEKPDFFHPDRTLFWKANQVLEKLDCSLESLRGLEQRSALYRTEIRQLVDFLRDQNHSVAIIGGIGIGKTTAICKLTSLEIPEATTPTTQAILEIGAGGTTLCEVVIKKGPAVGVLIKPRSENNIQQDVADLSEHLFSVANQQGKNPIQLGISEEVKRVILEMCDLSPQRIRDENGKRSLKRRDLELASSVSSATELSIALMTKLELHKRTLNVVWHEPETGIPAKTWLQNTFADVNNGRLEQFSIPSRIDVFVKEDIFEDRSLRLQVVDTKGIFRNAIRADLVEHFKNDHTLTVLCSTFNDAPNTDVQILLRTLQEMGIREVDDKSIICVLARPSEANVVKDAGVQVVDAQEGYEVKRDNVNERLQHMGLPSIETHFFNSLEDNPSELRDAIVQKIKEHRQSRREELQNAIVAVEDLVKSPPVFSSDLHIRSISELVAWLSQNKSIGQFEPKTQSVLIDGIGSVHPSTLHASIRRFGSWPNFDYYHYLGRGARKMAADRIYKKVNEIQDFITQMPNDSPQQGFLQSQALRLLDSSVKSLLQLVESAGMTAFRNELNSDKDFWNSLYFEWGVAVPGYRDRVATASKMWFENDLRKKCHTLISETIEKNWNDVALNLSKLLSTALVAESNQHGSLVE